MGHPKKQPWLAEPFQLWLQSWEAEREHLQKWLGEGATDVLDPSEHKASRTGAKWRDNGGCNTGFGGRRRLLGDLCSLGLKDFRTLP